MSAPQRRKLALQVRPKTLRRAASILHPIVQMPARAKPALERDKEGPNKPGKFHFRQRHGTPQLAGGPTCCAFTFLQTRWTLSRQLAGQRALARSLLLSRVFRDIKRPEPTLNRHGVSEGYFSLAAGNLGHSSLKPLGF